MTHGVLGGGYDLQVLGAIVVLDAVSVMHLLAIYQRVTEHLLSYQPMLVGVAVRVR
jgi:hypothetical protein